MKIINLISMLIILVCVFCGKNSNSPTENEFSKVFGYVFDKGTNEPIYRVSVLIKKEKDDTDMNGYYELNNIEIGEQIITATNSYSGSEPFYVTYIDTISVNAGDNQVDIYMVRK